MGGATPEFHRAVLCDTLRVLTDSQADHIVIGGTATKAFLGRDLSPDDDFDILVRRDDADRLLDVFAAAGYSTHRRDERWLYKAARPDVTVDLIFCAGEKIALDDTHLARSLSQDIHGITIPVPAVEDLIVMKVVFDGRDRSGRMYEALTLLATFPIDWDYLCERACALAPQRMLGFLLYAIGDGVGVPQDTLTRLAPSAIPGPTGSV